MIKKERNLQEYQHFNIEVRKLQGYEELYFVFTDTEGLPLSDWKAKLTPAQWRKAKKYATRELIPFSGYSYTIKPEYKILGAVYKIR